jgi:hypothetical protein
MERAVVVGGEWAARFLQFALLDHRHGEPHGQTPVKAGSVDLGFCGGSRRRRRRRRRRGGQ